MPTFCAVQCAFCQTFQVQQEKKSNQFKCPVCHKKQSVRQRLAIGESAKDIRLYVQELNMGRGEAAQQLQDRLLDDEQQLQVQQGPQQDQRQQKCNQHGPSCGASWEQFSAPEELEVAPAVDNEREEAGTHGGGNYVTCLPDKGQGSSKRSRGKWGGSQAGTHGRGDVDDGSAVPPPPKRSKPVTGTDARAAAWAPATARGFAGDGRGGYMQRMGAPGAAQRQAAPPPLPPLQHHQHQQQWQQAQQGRPQFLDASLAAPSSSGQENKPPLRQMLHQGHGSASDGAACRVLAATIIPPSRGGYSTMGAGGGGGTSGLMAGKPQPCRTAWQHNATAAGSSHTRAEPTLQPWRQQQHQQQPQLQRSSEHLQHHGHHQQQHYPSQPQRQQQQPHSTCQRQAAQAAGSSTPSMHRPAPSAAQSQAPALRPAPAARPSSAWLSYLQGDDDDDDMQAGGWAAGRAGSDPADGCSAADCGAGGGGGGGGGGGSFQAYAPASDRWVQLAQEGMGCTGGAAASRWGASLEPAAQGLDACQDVCIVTALD